MIRAPRPRIVLSNGAWTCRFHVDANVPAEGRVYGIGPTPDRAFANWRRQILGLFAFYAGDRFAFCPACCEPIRDRTHLAGCEVERDAYAQLGSHVEMVRG